MKIAVFYGRYSSDRQTEQSIEGQLHECQRFAERNDIIIVQQYIDRAMTGTNDDREAFQQMLKDSDKRAWDYVLVYKLDRFSRNKYEMAIHRKHLKDNGIKILSAMENIPDSPEGTLLESLLEGMNQYYSEELSQKTKRGMNETRMKGFFCGGVVNYGYSLKPIYSDESDKKTLIANKVIINEEEAPIVLEIFTEYANGKKVPDIIKNLEEHGILNRGAPFIQQTIYCMLRQEKYTGIYRINGLTFDKIYPQIVPFEIYEIVKRRIDANRHGKHTPDGSYLLRGLIYCGYCGKRIVSYTGTSKNGRVWRYYKCYQTRVNCKCGSVQKDALENMVSATLLRLFQSESNIEELVNSIYTTHNERVNNNLTLKHLEREYSKTIKALKNLIAAIEAGMFSDTTKDRLHELESYKKELEQKIAIEKTDEKQILSKSDIRKYLLTALRQNKKNLIDLLIEKITLYNNKAEIKLKYKHGKPNNDPPRRGRKSKKNSDGIESDRGSSYIVFHYQYELGKVGRPTLGKQTKNPPVMRHMDIEVLI